MIKNSTSQHKSKNSWFRWGILLTVILVSAWMTPRVRPATLNPDMLLKNALPAKRVKSFGKAIKDFQKVTGDFGFHRLLMVGIVAPKGNDALSPMAVKATRELSERLKNLSEVQSVLSLATSLTIKRGGDGLDVRSIFPAKDKPYTTADQKRIRKALLSDPLMRGNLISYDARASLLLCNLQEDKIDPGTTAFLRILRDVQRKYPKMTFGVNGLPVVKALLPSAYTKRPVFFLGLAFVLLLLILLARIGDGSTLLWSLMTAVFACVVGTVLVLWWWQDIGGVLVVMGLSATSLALAWGFTVEEQQTVGVVDFVRTHPLPMLWVAFALASLSTGLLLQWPMLVRMAFAVLLGAACTGVVGELGRLRPARDGASFKAASLRENSSWLRPLGSLAVATVIFVVGMSSLSFGRDVSTYYPGPLSLQRGHKYLNQHFGGATPLLLYFKGDLKNPVHLKAIDRLGRRLEEHAGIDAPQSIAFLIRHLNFLMNKTPRVPDTKGQIGALWSLMDGQAALKSLVQGQGKAGILQARIHLKRRLLEQCSGTSPRHRLCATSQPDALNRLIQSLMKDMPRRSQPVVWKKADTATRKRLLQQRSSWVAEGLELWWHRSTGQWLGRKRGELEKTLWMTLQQWSQGKVKVQLSQKRWKAILVPYLKSEDCDLELKKEEQKKVLDALLAAFAKKDFAFSRPSLKSLLAKTLEGTEAGKDKGGLKYAAKAIFNKGKKDAVSQQLGSLVSRVKQWFWKQAPASQKASLDKKWKKKGMLRLEMVAELAEMQNPHWTLLHKGKPLLEVRHAGLHKLLLPVAALSRSMGLWLPGLFVLFLFLLTLVQTRSLTEALLVNWPVLCGTLVLVGVLGLLQWSVDPVLLFGMVFAQFYMAHLSWKYRGESPRPLAALIVFLPAVALVFTEVPLLRHVGVLWALTVFVTILLLWVLRPSSTTSS